MKEVGLTIMFDASGKGGRITKETRLKNQSTGRYAGTASTDVIPDVHDASIEDFPPPGVEKLLKERPVIGGGRTHAAHIHDANERKENEVDEGD